MAFAIVECGMILCVFVIVFVSEKAKLDERTIIVNLCKKKMK